MSQRSGPSVTSLLPEKRRPGQAAAQSAAAGVEGRSPQPPSPGRAWDRAQGWPGRSGLGRRGEPGCGPGKLQAEERTSPLLLHPRSRQFPPRPETLRSARSTCRWRRRDTLGALLGVGGGAQPQRGSGAWKAREPRTWRRLGKGGRGRQNLHSPSGPALPPKWRESPEIRPAALAPRHGAASCVLLNSPLGHLPSPAELGATHLQQRDCC